MCTCWQRWMGWIQSHMFTCKKPPLWELASFFEDDMDEPQKPPGIEDVETETTKNCGMVPHIIFIADGKMHDCKAFIELSDTNSEMQWIFAMAIGMQAACHLTECTKNIKRFKSSNQVLFKEIQQCAHVLGIATPKYSNKKGANRKEWLNNNLAFSQSDIEFVCDWIKAFCEMLQTCDKTTGSIQSEKKNKAWVGDKPFLHLYHAIISDDNMKLAFISHQKTLSHSKLDCCNNPEKWSVSFYELLADRYNDPNFVVLFSKDAKKKLVQKYCRNPSSHLPPYVWRW